MLEDPPLTNMNSSSKCHGQHSIAGQGNKPITITFFSLGVVGNLLALFILLVHQKENRSRSSVFCILVTGLVLTDLLGTCLLSPPVFICYAHNMSLIGLGGEKLCNLFGFVMNFFGLASTLILCAMALERCMAISHPYFYSVHIRATFAKVALFFIYLFSLTFCLLPFIGYGKFRQYCPGTWCFMDMGDAPGTWEERGELILAFSLSYSSFNALLIFIVFVCNGSVIVSLCKMHRSHLMRRGSVVSVARKKKLSLAWFGRGEEELDHVVLLIFIVFVCNGSVIVSLCKMHRSHLMRRGSVVSVARKKKLSLAWFGRGEEELDHVVLLALITVIFVVCSLPLTIAGFMNAVKPFSGDSENFRAFRFYSLNAIMDPWVFIIFRKSVFRHLCSLLSCRFGKGDMKSTDHCALSFPLDHSIHRNP